jgi:hypothetical protein
VSHSESLANLKITSATLFGCSQVEYIPDSQLCRTVCGPPLRTHILHSDDSKTSHLARRTKVLCPVSQRSCQNLMVIVYHQFILHFLISPVWIMDDPFLDQSSEVDRVVSFDSRQYFTVFGIVFQLVENGFNVSGWRVLKSEISTCPAESYETYHFQPRFGQQPVVQEGLHILRIVLIFCPKLCAI